MLSRMVRPLVAASSAIDPATLALTMYQINFAGLPWAGTASAGSSSSQSFVTSAADPTVGASFGAHASADFSGAQYCGANAFTWGTILGAGTAWTLHFIAQFDTLSAPAGAGSEYLDPALLAGVSFGGVYVRATSSGVAAGFYDGSVYKDTPYVAISTGVKYCIQTVYDGVNLKIRVNGGTFQTVAAGTGPAAGPLGDTPIMGASYAATGKIDGRIAMAAGASSTWNLATLDGTYAHAQANYAVP